MVLLLILGTLLLCALLISGGMWLGQRRASLSKYDREELQTLRRTVAKIDGLAFRDRDVYPEMSTQIIGIILDHHSHLTKELP
jgi:hypothetical protein